MKSVSKRSMIERYAIENAHIISGVPFKRYGFRQRLMKLAERMIDDGFSEHAKNLLEVGGKFVPDGSHFYEDTGFLHVLEVEDTSTMPLHKLDMYLNIFEELDACDQGEYGFTLWVSSRYGEPRVLSLSSLWMARLRVESLEDEPKESKRSPYRRRFSEIMNLDFPSPPPAP